MKINVIKFDPKEVKPDELWHRAKEIKEKFPDDTFIFLPNNWEFWEDVDIERVKSFRDKLDKIIEEKENDK